MSRSSKARPDRRIQGRRTAQDNGRRGIAVLEFALVAPVVIIIIFGTVEMASVFRAQAKVNTATGVLAMLVAAQATVTAPSGSLADLCTGAAFNLMPFPRDTLSADIVAITNDHPSNRVLNSTDTSSVYNYLDWESISSCATSSPTTMSSSGAYALANAPMSLLTKSGATAASNSDLAYGYSAIVVKTTYRYRNILTYFLGQSITLNGTAVARPRSNATVQCTNGSGGAKCPSLQ